MKFIISILLIAAFSFITCLYLPWWSIAIAAFMVTLLLNQKPLSAFIAGFVALFILWGLLANFISGDNGHILARKISIVMLKSDSSAMLIMVTGAIGALTAGFAALSGSFLRSLIPVK
jgi:hypothetical protein